MNFKDFLQEQTLKSSIYNKTLERLADEALLGYELEMWVPSTSALFVGEILSSGAETESISNLKSLADWRRHFRISSDVNQDMLDDYRDWYDNGHKGMMWDEFVDAQFKGPEQFIKHYDIQPQYGWSNIETGEVFTSDPEGEDGEADFDGTAQEIAREMGDYLGVKMHIGYSGTNDKWRVVEDGSIGGKGVGVGVEVVSPPLPVLDALDDLNESFHFMANEGLVTNETTGLHLNLSIPDMKRKLDPLKLILFMGEDHLLKSYNRQENSYATKHTDDLLDHVKKTGTIPKAADDLINFARAALKREKYRTVNLAKLLAGYLEFRIAGNENYHKKFKQVKDNIGRYLTLIEIACDPDSNRNEYLKKLTKLIGRGTEQKVNFDLSEVIESMKRQEMKTRVDFDDPTDNLVHIIHFLGRRVFAKNIELPDDFKDEFRSLYLKIKKSEPDVMERITKRIDVNDPHLVAFMRVFRVK